MRKIGLFLLLSILTLAIIASSTTHQNYHQINHKPKNSGSVDNNTTKPEQHHPPFRNVEIPNEELGLRTQSISKPRINKNPEIPSKFYINYIDGTPPPSNGDWVIDTVTIVNDSKLIINGSIIVENSGILIIVNSYIYINLGLFDSYGIDVYGNLTVLNSMITSYNTSYLYHFRAYNGSTLKIEDSVISFAGFRPGPNYDEEGIWIATQNATITNSIIENNTIGIILYKTENVVIANNTIRYNEWRGILLILSEDIVIDNNMLYDNGYDDYGYPVGWGIAINDSTGCVIKNNNIVNSGRSGLVLGHSQSNIIINNTLINDTIFVDAGSNNNIANNTVNGKPLLYLENAENTTINSDAGQVVLLYSKNITIESQTIENVDIGIEIYNSQNVEIRESTILEASRYGLYIIHSTNINITQIMVSEGWCGIDVKYNSNVTITRSSANETKYGIIIYRSQKIIVSENTFKFNIYGVIVSQSSSVEIISNVVSQNSEYGLMIYDSNTVIRDCTISNNSRYGINLSSASGNFIFHNTIAYNGWYGIYLFSSTDNYIFLNDFIGNLWQADAYGSYFFSTPRPIAYIYNGKLSIGQLGNYWDDYNGTDSNGDYIGDDLYTSKRIVDNTPLMGSYQNYIIGDYDKDGIFDIYELALYNSDPLSVDSDGDLIPDGWEIKYGLNPASYADSQNDSDGDGLTNLEEYLNGLNPRSSDTDGDGMPDGWETTYGLNPLRNESYLDPDGDGLLNIDEYKHNTDPLTADTDGDGMPDGWETTYGLNPTDSSDASLDPDGDGLTNAREYALGLLPNNSDTDGDGMPDGWETTYGLDPLDHADSYEDYDGDSLTNLDEYIHRTNPRIADTDGDGMPDGWETTYGLDPLNYSDVHQDLDNDGLNNGLEFLYGTDPTNNDTDKDGFLDGVEVSRGSNPLDPGEYPEEVETITEENGSGSENQAGEPYSGESSGHIQSLLYVLMGLTLINLLMLVLAIYKGLGIRGSSST